MSKKILITPGDGIGKEVTSSAKEVLDFLIDEYQLDYEVKQMDVGGTSYNIKGSPLPNEVLDEAKKSDAILFGAVGGPEWDELDWESRPEQAFIRPKKRVRFICKSKACISL
jgi:3-isopropylmalate dehydrogenase